MATGCRASRRFGALPFRALAGGVVEVVMYARLPQALNLQSAAAAGAVTHLLFAGAVVMWPSISAFTLGGTLSEWWLLYGARIVVLGIDRLRHGHARELAAFIEANDGTTFGNLLGAYAVAAWDRTFDDIDVADIVDQVVLPIVERLADACVATGPEAVSLLADAELLQLTFLVSPIWETEPWASRSAENTLGNEPIDAPLLIVQGTDDVLIRADIQRRFVQRLCASGQQLQYRELTDVGHLAVDDVADTYAVQ